MIIADDVQDIFNKMEYSETFSNIISDLDFMSDSTEGKLFDPEFNFTLTHDLISTKNLKYILVDVLGSDVSDDEIESFVSIFDEFYSRIGINEPSDFGIKISKRLYDIFDDISNKNPNNLLAMDMLNLKYEVYENEKKIKSLDIGDKNYLFNVTLFNGSKRNIPIETCIKNFYKNIYTKSDIRKFMGIYAQSLKDNPEATPIKLSEFKLNPKDVRNTFLSLVRETYPMGHEDEVLEFLPDGLEKDKWGNYYYIIGNSDTSFTCHLDTVSTKKSRINLMSFKKGEQEFIKSDGTTILGSDDKSGVTILLYLMAHNIPGVYWFFMGEERGGVGSKKVASEINSYPFMKDIKKMISFDRRNYYSVITKQRGEECCSDEFAQSLCDELNKSGLKMAIDPTGVFTDSASFIDIIPECTNVSVGYFNEHTNDEHQNITFLERLAEACVKVKWDKLEVKRKVGFDEALKEKYKDLIKDILQNHSYYVVKGRLDKLEIGIFTKCYTLDDLYKMMERTQLLLKKHSIQDPIIIFDEKSDDIKIELK